MITTLPHWGKFIKTRYRPKIKLLYFFQYYLAKWYRLQFSTPDTNNTLCLRPSLTSEKKVYSRFTNTYFIQQSLPARYSLYKSRSWPGVLVTAVACRLPIAHDTMTKRRWKLHETRQCSAPALLLTYIGRRKATMCLPSNAWPRSRQDTHISIHDYRRK